MTRVLVIDDEPVVRTLMVEILARAGYEAIPVDSAEGALERLDDPEVRLVLSDIVMPGRTGFELLESVRAHRPSLPVLLVTGSGTQDNLQEALSHGAAGLITKPFTHAQLREHVASVLARASLSEQELRERVIPPALARTLADAVTARDDTTGGHTERLVALALRLGREVGLRQADLDAIRLGASLHDIGKIGIPDRILLKPGALTAEEWALMQTHAPIGDRLLEPVAELAAARPVVRSHHERWDGKGYPDGLAGAEIPLTARLVAVADAIEAMAAARPYRSPLTREGIVSELRRGQGSQWDPELAELAIGLIARGEIVLSPAGAFLAAGRSS